MTKSIQGLAMGALLAVSCSVSQSPSSTGPSTPAAANALEGRLASSAAGDVKSGNGVLELVRLRMDRQRSGTSVFRQYAEPNGRYTMIVGETIELWAEWDPGAGPQNPRLIVDWGDGSSDFAGCGSCKLTHRYDRTGRTTVTVKLDDRVSTTITRTFFLEALPLTAHETCPQGTYSGLGDEVLWGVPSSYPIAVTFGQRCAVGSVFAVTYPTFGCSGLWTVTSTSPGLEVLESGFDPLVCYNGNSYLISYDGLSDTVRVSYVTGYPPPYSFEATLSK